MKKGIFITTAIVVLTGLAYAGLRSDKISPGKVNTSSDSKISNVAGAQRGDEGREQKKALILSPYKWDFGENDDSKVPVEMLKKHRNYQGRITYKENATKTSGNITIDDYLSLDQYDFIFIGSHGSRECQIRDGEVEIVTEGNSNMCLTVINTGIHFKEKDKAKVRKAMDARGIEGLAYSKTEIYLKPEFFSANFKDLSFKIIVFSACETDQHNSLRLAMQGAMNNGQAFLWSNVVYTDDAGNAYRYLLKRMIEYGETATLAYQQMPGNLKDHLKSFFQMMDENNQSFEVETTTSLEMVEKGDAMHLIEPVTFLNEKSHEPISNGDIYAFEGIFDDDKNEKASFILELLGYTVDELKEMSVSIKVDHKIVVDYKSIVATKDMEIKPGKNEKTTIVTIKDVDLQKDLKKNKQVKLEVLFHLSESNYGYQKVMVATENSDMRIEMQGDGERTTMYYDADNEGMKMVYPKENQTMYGDVQGYYYVHSKEEGWMKTKMKSIMRTLNRAIPIDPSFLASIPDKGTFLHKIPYFAAEITISKLESMPDARKISSPTDEKTVFVARNTTLTFDKLKRLESIKQGSAFIQYYYEPQEIKFPQAKTINLPF